jgi:hypothetical protein
MTTSNLGRGEESKEFDRIFKDVNPDLYRIFTETPEQVLNPKDIVNDSKKFMKELKDTAIRKQVRALEYAVGVGSDHFEDIGIDRDEYFKELEAISDKISDAVKRRIAIVGPDMVFKEDYIIMNEVLPEYSQLKDKTDRIGRKLSLNYRIMFEDAMQVFMFQICIGCNEYHALLSAAKEWLRAHNKEILLDLIINGHDSLWAWDDKLRD